jgi:hypothetical protein
MDDLNAKAVGTDNRKGRIATGQVEVERGIENILIEAAVGSAVFVSASNELLYPIKEFVWIVYYGATLAFPKNFSSIIRRFA